MRPEAGAEAEIIFIINIVCSRLEDDRMKKRSFLPLLLWNYYYRTVLSVNIYLELEPEPKLWTKVEPEPKINHFGSAILVYSP